MILKFLIFKDLAFNKPYAKRGMWREKKEINLYLSGMANSSSIKRRGIIIKSETLPIPTPSYTKNFKILLLFLDLKL